MALTRVTGSLKSKEGKLVRVSVYYAPQGVDSVMITGDFFMEPPEVLDQLMGHLKGLPVEQVPSKVKEFLESKKPIMVGVTADDFVAAFQKAITSGEKETIERKIKKIRGKRGPSPPLLFSNQPGTLLLRPRQKPCDPWTG
ncbi:hypothetical protein PQ610_01085 [Tardisphaera miroshnichenkoae]